MILLSLPLKNNYKIKLKMIISLSYLPLLNKLKNLWIYNILINGMEAEGDLLFP
jgi:hypothetical protein